MFSSVATINNINAHVSEWETEWWRVDGRWRKVMVREESQNFGDKCTEQSDLLAIRRENETQQAYTGMFPSSMHNAVFLIPLKIEPGMPSK